MRFNPVMRHLLGLFWYFFLIFLWKIAAERIVIYRTVIKGGAGISDRKMTLGILLRFASSLNATLSFARPCEALNPLHSKVIADCRYGWNYYLSVNPFFYGYYDSFETPNCTKTINLTREVLTKLQTPPPGDDVCFTLKLYIWGINKVLEETTRRLLQNQGLPAPEIVIKSNPSFGQFANQLLAEYRIQPHRYHAMKIRRFDYHQFINCTKTTAIVAKMSNVYEKLPPETRSYPWIIFGYVEEGYWQDLRQSLEKYFQELFVDKPKPAIYLEPEIRFHGLRLQEAFHDNYILIEMIQHILNHGKTSIGTHPWEGRDHLCGYKRI